jgi:hypothetical protein
MLLDLTLPAILEPEAETRVFRLLVERGARIERGTALLELQIDLSAVAAQNCPPVSHYRLVSLETGWVRAIVGSPGERRALGEQLMRVSTTVDEPVDGRPPARELRTSIAGIVVLPKVAGEERLPAGRPGERAR